MRVLLRHRFRVAIVTWLAVAMSAACGGGPQETRPGVPVSSMAQDTAAAPPPEGGRAPLTPMPAHAPAMGVPAGDGASGEIVWTTAKEWIEETPKSSMRKAQYRLPAAPGDKEDGECVVYYFGAGQGGDVKANQNRWAAQFHGWGSTPPKCSEMRAGGLSISRAEVKGTYTPSPMGMSGGPEPQPMPDFMLLGAIVPGSDANWFFKCTGPVKTMEANRARFDALLESLHPAQ